MNLSHEDKELILFALSNIPVQLNQDDDGTFIDQYAKFILDESSDTCDLADKLITDIENIKRKFLPDVNSITG
ncbi:hypothetical protein [Cyanothece sp. BG0011]|uniref:hypothetical protein n=1 Tax=Cyanothece sp. BG0011 TaxID=2082950 RepID=UPI000D1D85FE|nr:hypothetical protein [Cyanothece sp. BG0011]